MKEKKQLMFLNVKWEAKFLKRSQVPVEVGRYRRSISEDS